DALFRGRSAARDGDIQHLDATLSAKSVQFPRTFRGDRAHLQHDGSWPRLSKKSRGPGKDALNCFIVGQTRENHVGTACQFENVLRNDTAPRGYCIRFGDVPVVDEDLVSVSKQALCDSASHVAQANKSKYHVIRCKKCHSVSVIAR